MTLFYTHFSRKFDHILFRGYENGQRVQKKIKYQPSLFVESTKTQTKYQTYNGTFLDKITFSTMNEASAFIKQYKDTSSFPIYGNQSFEFAFISDLFPDKANYDVDLIKVMNFDIETTSDHGFPDPESCLESVIAITCEINGKYTVFGLGEYKEHREDVRYFRCASEQKLLEHFINYVVINDPDIYTGWNISMFDFPYLRARIEKILGKGEAMKLSPWRDLKTRQMSILGMDYAATDFVGISTLDYLEVYKRFSPGNRESYRLDAIANRELGEGKLSFEGYSSSIELYKHDYQKFIEYNIKDVELVKRLEDKMKLIELVLAMSYDANVNYIDSFKQVRLWDSIIFNDFRQKNWVVPPKKINDNDSYPGGYVKDVITGLHDWVLSFDLNSLYPHLIAQYNISPEKIVDLYKDVTVDDLLNRLVDTSHLRENNVNMAANGHHFLNDSEGFLPKILMTMYNERKIFKNKMLDSENLLESIEQEMKRRNLDVR